MSESVCRSSPVVATPESYAGGPGDLLVAVDDPAAVEVVRRELDLHPVSGEDTNAVAPHLPGRISERLVAPVECNPEITVPQSLDDLAVELDLLFFLGYYASSLLRNDVDRLGALLALARLELDLGTLGQRLEAVAGDVRVMHEEILAAVLGGDEAVSLGIVEPLDGSGCHVISSLDSRRRTSRGRLES